MPQSSEGLKSKRVKSQYQKWGKTGLWVHTALIPQTVRVKSSFSPSSVSKGKISCLLLCYIIINRFPLEFGDFVS